MKLLSVENHAAGVIRETSSPLPEDGIGSCLYRGVVCYFILVRGSHDWHQAALEDNNNRFDMKRSAPI